MATHRHEIAALPRCLNSLVFLRAIWMRQIFRAPMKWAVQPSRKYGFYVQQESFCERSKLGSKSLTIRGGGPNPFIPRLFILAMTLNLFKG